MTAQWEVTQVAHLDGTPEQVEKACDRIMAAALFEVENAGLAATPSTGRVELSCSALADPNESVGEFLRGVFSTAARLPVEFGPTTWKRAQS